MKKFSFELQTVLEYRSFLQQQAESELQKALAVENEIKNNLNTIAQQYASTKQSNSSSLDFAEIYSANQFYKLLDYQKEELLKQLTEAQMVTAQKRAALNECMKKTNALEKLKEKQLEDYKKAVRKAENDFNDELGSVGYFRNMTPAEPSV